MPIPYKLTRVNDNINPNPEIRYSVTVVTSPNINLEHISRVMSNISSFSPADVQGLVTGLIDLMSDYLENGHTVTLDGLGTFWPTACLKKEVKDPREVRAASVELKSIAFRPAPSFKIKAARTGFVRVPENK